ncbi:Fc.00g057880.m01.CDS01 [Cosmosporella sp. VM-42]
MGCGSSKPSRNDRQQLEMPARPVIGGPIDVQIHIPRHRADEHGVPVQEITRDIDRDVLLAALNHVSVYIAQRRQQISVMAVDLNNHAHVLLDASMQDAQRHIHGLGTDSLNTETQVWMPGPIHQELTAAAREQNVKVFDGAELGIYAAPWDYALSAKIIRLMAGGDQARPYDLQDAATYFRQYIQAHDNRPVTINIALGWARHYHHEANIGFLNHINREYRRQYRSNGLACGVDWSFGSGRNAKRGNKGDENDNDKQSRITKKRNIGGEL